MASPDSPVILVPKKLPDETHHVIVVLEAVHVPTLEFDTSPMTHEVLAYQFTGPKDDVAERIRCASIIVIGVCPITAETLSQAPYLKTIVTQTTGLNHVDLEACRKHGISVKNSPGALADTVAEHAVAFYFTLRRALPRQKHILTSFDQDGFNALKGVGSLVGMLRDADSMAQPSRRSELVGVLGHGLMAQATIRLFRQLRMQVVVAARKRPASSAPAPAGAGSEPRVPFEEVIRKATVIVVLVPLNEGTAGYLSAAEFAQMRPQAIVINVGRGGTVDEAGALDALEQGKIYGFATDVYPSEPACSEDDSVLLSPRGRGLNLALSHHLAYWSVDTLQNLSNMAAANIRSYLDGTDLNLVVP